MTTSIGIGIGIVNPFWRHPSLEALGVVSAPWIETVPWSESTGLLKEAYDWQARSLGEPTEFTQLGSLYPELVQRRLELYKVVEGCPSALHAVERKLAAFAVSTLTGTPHCSSGLRAKLAELDVDRALVDRIATGPGDVELDDPRLEAILAYAAKLTRTPGQITLDDIERLRSLGLGDLEILDLNNIVAYYNYVNRVANGLGLRTTIPEAHALHAVPR